MEKPKAGAPMHGFTANYIRVEVESDAALDNKVVNVLWEILMKRVPH